MKHVNVILRKEIARQSLPLVGVVLLILIATALDALAPWSFKLLIDNVLSGNPIDPESPFAFLSTLFHSSYSLGLFAVFLYFASTFILALVEYLKSLATKRVVNRLISEFSKAAFKNLQTIALGFFSKQKIGDYIYRLGYDVSAVGTLLEEGVLAFLVGIIHLTVTISIMALISPSLTILSLTALPFLAGGLYVFNSRITHATKRSEFLNSAAFAFIEETLNHLKVIQAFSQEHRTSHGFNQRLDNALEGDLRVSKLDFFLSLVIGMIIAASYSVIMLYGIQAVFAGTLTTGLLIVFILYLDNLTNPLISLIYAATAARESYIKVSRMEDFFSTKSHINYHRGRVRKLTGLDIHFHHVSLQIGDERVLDDASFTLEAGKRTVIFGGSGSGKTSVANILMRFIESPTSGQIYIGSTPLEEYDVEALRGTIAYVPQEITLFNDSIRNNIIFGNHHHSQVRFMRAARRAAVADFVHTLPGGYDFRVGDGGGFLSGGQKQRVMLARALMREEAQILIFDETFSALDIKTRTEVLAHVRDFSHGKTAIIISNVFDVIRGADNIVVLNHGKVLYSGPSQRLPKEISLYQMIAGSEPLVEE